MRADFPVVLDTCVLAEAAVSDLYLRLAEDPRSRLKPEGVNPPFDVEPCGVASSSFNFGPVDFKFGNSLVDFCPPPPLYTVSRASRNQKFMFLPQRGKCK